VRLVVLDTQGWTVWQNFTNIINSYNNDSIWSPFWSNFDRNLHYASNAVPAPTSSTLSWNANCPLNHFTGFTAVSQCNSFGNASGYYGNAGQFPVTALTKRHGYLRGHGNGGNQVGQKVWFCTAYNQIVEMTVLKSMISSSYPTNNQTANDYGLVLFSTDLPSTITPMLVAHSLRVNDAVEFSTHQGGTIDANALYFTPDMQSRPPCNNTYNVDGDSGSPVCELTTDGKLVFIHGDTTASPSDAMQSDMDYLCNQAGLNPADYKMQYAW
jgi:hypothetical protein